MQSYDVGAALGANATTSKETRVQASIDAAGNYDTSQSNVAKAF